MHILYLHQYFVPPDGSGGTRSYEMARRFVISGNKVTMITSSAFFPATYRFTNRITDLDIEGINLKVIDVPYSNKLPYAQRIKAFIDFAIQAIVQSNSIQDVDIVFATSTPLTIAIPGVIAKYKHKCPMVFEVRDLWPELPIAIGAIKNPLIIRIARLLERWAYRNSEHVIALSPGMMYGVVQTGYPKERVSVIPNSCDVALFRSPTINGSDFTDRYPFLKEGALIVYAGTFGIINGVNYLVDIAVEMSKIDSTVRFAVVGDGKQKLQLLEHARNRGVLEKNFWVIPPVSKREMPNLLAAATMALSLFIDLPEMWNNSANKFFDALASSRPIMINYGGWQAELLTSTGAGLVVPPRDPLAAASLLYQFISDPERLNKAEVAAGNLATTVFDRDLLYDSLYDVLKKVYNKSTA